MFPAHISRTSYKNQIIWYRSIYFPSMQVGADEEAQYDSNQRKSNPPSCIALSSSTAISCKRHRKQILEQTEH